MTTPVSETALTPERRKDVFIVVPAFNEAAAIESVVLSVRASYANVIVVDDGSSDNTTEVAGRVAPFVLRHPVNRGQGAALQTGLDFALARGARILVTFDADGQHRTEDIDALVAPIDQGRCDITLGSRFLDPSAEIPASRRALLRWAVMFTRLVNRMNLSDAHNGLRAFSRRAALRINITMDRMAHASELLDQIRYCGLRYEEVPVHIRYTDYSIRKGQSWRGAFRIVLHYLLGKVFR